MATSRTIGRVIGIPIDVLAWNQAVTTIIYWAAARSSRYVTLCNVHATVTAASDPEFQRIITDADMALPDGAPVAWMLRRKGHTKQTRISGPDLMEELLKRSIRSNIRVFFYGSTKRVLSKLKRRLLSQYPELQIAGMISPPFRPIEIHEDDAYVRQINDSRAGIVFVGLGCPKQERWMANHRSRIEGVLVGVGAAFDFHAGTLQRAPLWIRRSGFEWLHRLSSEPMRLIQRYLRTNSLFLLLAAMDLIDRKKALTWLTTKLNHRSRTD